MVYLAIGVFYYSLTIFDGLITKKMVSTNPRFELIFDSLTNKDKIPSILMFLLNGSCKEDFQRTSGKISR